MCKCDSCAIMDAVQNSKEPACCVWYMDNVVIDGKSVEECTEYKPKREE